MRLIIASNNANKAKEIKEILGGFFEEILTMREAGIRIEVEEDADTFEGNALKKAKEIFAAADADAVLSDDSGLMVDALDGAPGVYSARYAGEGHDDGANNEKLIEAMAGVPEHERGCGFVCAVALIRRGREPVTAVGTVRGRLLGAPLGENGFGYDPLFYYEPFGRSFAQLDPQEKNQVSHRKRALFALCEKLKEEQP